MFDPILVVCPGFRDLWDIFVENWKDDPETAETGLPYYLALGDLARFLHSKMEAHDTHEFGAIFDVVEAWHVNGDQYVSEAATIGLLEGLQGCATEKQQTLIFNNWLGPESKKAWVALNQFWDHVAEAKNKGR